MPGHPLPATSIVAAHRAISVLENKTELGLVVWCSARHRLLGQSGVIVAQSWEIQDGGWGGNRRKSKVSGF